MYPAAEPCADAPPTLVEALWAGDLGEACRRAAEVGSPAERDALQEELFESLPPAVLLQQVAERLQGPAWRGVPGRDTLLALVGASAPSQTPRTSR